MSVFEVHCGPVDRRYLMKKSKDELATLVLDLLKGQEARDANMVDAGRLHKLLEFCTEAKTHFGPRGDLRAITMKFKNSVETSYGYRNELRKLIDEIQPTDNTKAAK